MGDSALDILEMAGYGAAAGLMIPIPGVGPALGATVGAVAGVATETWQYFNQDPKENGDALPSTNISSGSTMNPIGQAANLTNNIDMVVNVDPSMVTTTADVNGEDYEIGGSYEP